MSIERTKGQLVGAVSVLVEHGVSLDEIYELVNEGRREAKVIVPAPLAPAADAEIEFGEIGPEGYSNMRKIRQSDVAACPHFILVPEHYREDGTCLCDDPDAPGMAEWGYEWNGGRWAASGEES